MQEPPYILHSLEIIDHIGGYSGIRINWDKSVLSSLHPSGSGAATGTPLQWVEEFKYLGINVRGSLQAYIADNLSPLLAQ